MKKKIKKFYCITIPFKTLKAALDAAEEIPYYTFVAELDEKYYDMIMKNETPK